MVDVTSIVRDFILKKDWYVNENANIRYSFSSLLNKLSGSCMKEFVRKNLYGEKLFTLHERGIYHIHDLPQGIAPYCSGWPTSLILREGINGINGVCSSRPPRHLRSAINQIVNFVGCISNEMAGAQAFNNFDTLLGGLVYSDYKNYIERYGKDTADKLIYTEVKQCIQELLFHLNYPNRWGSQSPFTNVSLDLIIPQMYESAPVIVGDEDLGVTYGQLQEYVDIFNICLFDNLLEGDSESKGFTFPVITISYTEDIFSRLNVEVKNRLLDVIRKYGSVYIQNCENGVFSGDKKIDLASVRSMCCRLQLDVDEIKSNTGLFGFSDYTGSIGVVTLNLPLIAYLSHSDISEFKRNLVRVMLKASECLMIKREVCTELFERGLFPFQKRYLVTGFKNHFNTIGYIGLHEALIILGFENGIVKKEGRDEGVRILELMREVTNKLKSGGVLYNLEATPSEGASYRLAMASKKYYPDIYTSGNDKTPYFTNSCLPPSTMQGDVLFLTSNQEPLQIQHSGGTVLHYYVGEMLDRDQTELFIKKICSTKIPYFTITTVYSICPVHGYIPGRWDFCPLSHTEEELERYGTEISDISFILKGNEDVRNQE